MKKKLLKLIADILSFIFKTLEDICLIIGIILLSKGVFLINIPAGYITLGTLLIALAMIIAIKNVKQ